ncbi:MAG: hypothetical protein IJH68_01045 [Thermoguttaceae bacterium]|nr:hypothetical protein [Thermoguttaceae bacterium]
MTYERKRVYILVKTYPTISEKYVELVCTAGVLEDGSWIRLYPVPLRKLDPDKQYSKFTWVNVDVTRNTSDFRPESYRPDLTSIRVEEKPKKIDWNERNEIIFKNKKIYTNLQELVCKAKSKDYATSLAVFKPSKILDVTVEPVSREWDREKLDQIKAQSHQQNFFYTPEELEECFSVVKKVPYKFSYKFEDDAGKQSTLMIEDWEIGILFFKCAANSVGGEEAAIQKVRQKYLEEFVKNKDLYFFLGTTKRFHNVSPNPFIIIGVYYPPRSLPPKQNRLFA